MNKRKNLSVIFAVSVTQFAAPFMLSAVGVALPSIGQDFAAHGVALSLVESVFLGVTAMFLLPFGRASDLVGRAALFTVGITIFTSTTLALGFAPNIETLIAIRALQAFGGAMQVSTGLALLMEVISPERRGQAMGIVLASVYLGVSAGPFLGGLIVATWGWRWLFFVGTVPCAIAFAAALNMRPHFHRPTAPFDWPGTGLSMIAVGLFVYGGANVRSLSGVAALAGAVIALIGFVQLERRTDHPLVDLSLFHNNPRFSVSNLLQLLNYSATFGLTFLLSLFLQLGHDMTPAEAGRILVIQPIVQVVFAPICGRLADRVPETPLVTFGMLLGAIGVIWASTFDAQTSTLTVQLLLGLMGLGVAFFVAPNMSLLMSAVPRARYGVATAISGQMRTLGMTTGMVAISAGIASIVGDRVLDATAFTDFNHAMRVVLMGFATVGSIGVGLSLLTAGKRQAGAVADDGPATSHAP